MKLQYLGKPDVNLLKRISYPIIKNISTYRQPNTGKLKESYIITNNKLLLIMAEQYLYKNSFSGKHPINSIFFEDSNMFSEIEILADLFDKVIVTKVITVKNNIDLMIKVNGLSSVGEKYIKNIIPNTEYNAFLYSLYVVNIIDKAELESGVYKFIKKQVHEKRTEVGIDLFVEDDTLTGINVSALSIGDIMTSEFIYNLLSTKKEVYLVTSDYNGIQMKTICWEYTPINKNQVYL